MFVKPIIILGAPRSGTTILHRSLAAHPDLWHLARESHSILEGPFHPARTGHDSNRVTASQVSERVAAELRAEFRKRAINLNQVVGDPSLFLAERTLLHRLSNRLALWGLGVISRIRASKAQIRFLEKTPKNSLRIPMIEVLFPDAHYVWIRRESTTNIDSLITGWRATDQIGPFRRRRYASAGYPVAKQLNLRDYSSKWWKFALVPRWRELEGKTVADVAAWQYYQCNRFILDDLKQVERDRVFTVTYEDFVERPVAMLRDLLDWAQLRQSPVVDRFAARLPPVNVVGSELRPTPGELRHPQEVRAAIRALPSLAELEEAVDRQWRPSSS